MGKFSTVMGERFDNGGEPLDKHGTHFRQRQVMILNAFDTYGEPPPNFRQRRNNFDKSGRSGLVPIITG